MFCYGDGKSFPELRNGYYTLPMGRLSEGRGLSGCSRIPGRRPVFIYDGAAPAGQWWRQLISIIHDSITLFLVSGAGPDFQDIESPIHP